MSDRSDGFISRIRQTNSEIEAYKVLIELKRDATPGELDRVVTATAGQIAVPELEAQLLQLHKLSFSWSRTPQAYRCVENGKGISHFRGPATPNKLLLAFCGSAQFLFGPAARVLQYFPSDEFEIIVLRDPDKAGFTQGIAGLSKSFPGAIDALRERYLSASVKSVLCMGMSGGGGPALAAARLLSAEAGVSFAGRVPTSSRNFGETVGAIEMDRILARQPAPPQRLHVVYSAQHVGDVRKAGRLSEVSGATLMPVANATEHNVLHHLHLCGELERMLRSTGLLA